MCYVDYLVSYCTGVEITDEAAEQIFTCNDAVELLKVKLGLEESS